MCFFFFSSRRRHTRFDCDWSSDVCSSDLMSPDVLPKTGPGRIRTYDQGIHLAPAFPPGVDYLFTRARPVRVGAGCSSLLSRALEPSGSLCTFRRCTGGSAQGCHGITHPEGFPEFIPSTSRVSARRHLVDESPALTAVLQAQPRRL